MNIEIQPNQSALVISDNGDVKAYVNTEVTNQKEKEATVSTALVAALSYLLKTSPKFMAYVTNEFDNAIKTVLTNGNPK